MLSHMPSGARRAGAASGRSRGWPTLRSSRPSMASPCARRSSDGWTYWLGCQHGQTRRGQPGGRRRLRPRDHAGHGTVGRRRTHRAGRALAGDLQAKAAWDKLPCSQERRYAKAITGAKVTDTRPSGRVSRGVLSRRTSRRRHLRRSPPHRGAARRALEQTRHGPPLLEHRVAVVGLEHAGAQRGAASSSASLAAVLSSIIGSDRLA